MGSDGFNWFVGVVEDRFDPKYTGRVKVRALGYHTPDLTLLPTTDLPWASVMNPITSATVSGKGQSPLGLLEGSWVVGFFIDGKEAQQPCVIGSLPGAPTSTPSGDSNIGFQDPYGNYPSDIGTDVNKLAVNATIDVPDTAKSGIPKVEFEGTEAKDGPDGSPEHAAKLARESSSATIKAAQLQADTIHHLEVVKGFGKNTSVADITQAANKFQQNYAKKYGLPKNVFDAKEKIVSGSANDLITVINAAVNKVSGADVGSLLKDSILFNAKGEIYTPGSLKSIVEADLSPSAAVNFAAGKLASFNYNDLSTTTLDSFAAKKPSEIVGNLIPGNITVADIGGIAKDFVTKTIQSNPALSLMTRLSDVAVGVPVASVDAVGNIGGGFANLLAANPLSNFAVPGQLASELAGLAEVVSLGQQIGGAFGVDTSILDDVSNIAGTVTSTLGTVTSTLNSAGSFASSIATANPIGTFNNAAGNFSSNLGDAAGVGANLGTFATTTSSNIVNAATGGVSTSSGFLQSGGSFVNSEGVTINAATGGVQSSVGAVTSSGSSYITNAVSDIQASASSVVGGLTSIVDGSATSTALANAANAGMEAVENQIAGVSLDLGTSWSEPPTNADQTRYPFNHVYETEGGHVREYDDTQGFKRIHERHASGTAYEIFDDGTKVTRLKKDQYHIVSANDYVHIQGYANQTLDKGLRVLVNSSGKAGNNYNIEVGKGANVTIQCNKGDINLIAKDGDINMKASGDINMQAGDNMNNLAGKAVFNSAGASILNDAPITTDKSKTHFVFTGAMDITASTTVDITTSIATIVAPARLDLNPITGGCFVKGTMIEMADGSEREITSINVGEKTRGGTVQAKMEFMPQVIYNYKDVFVSGSHWVIEDNQFVAVEDSKHGIITDTIEPVYTFKTSYNRIWIKGIEFGDFETGSDDDWDPHFEAVRQKLNEKLKQENI